MAYITLSKSAFFHNLAFLSQKLGSKEKLAIVLKDNAYGHGLLPMAKLAHEYGLNTAIVRTYQEAEQLKTLFNKVIILNPVPPYIHTPFYSLTINDITQIPFLPKGSKVELKIDTGMHRNGIHPDNLHNAFGLIQKHQHILEGVMTHFRSADELGSELFWQIQTWNKIKKEVKALCQKYKVLSPLFHSANSAATLRLKTYDDDFARCGIAAYGYHQMPEIFGTYNLKPVLKLYTEKIATTKLSKGQRIGYGGTFTALDDMIISTYDIGYGDGFFRFDGKGEFFLSGKKVLGKISMDSLSLEGNDKEISLIGNAREIADFFGTISYDILVKLNPQIKRIVIH